MASLNPYPLPFYLEISKKRAMTILSLVWRFLQMVEIKWRGTHLNENQPILFSSLDFHFKARELAFLGRDVSPVNLFIVSFRSNLIGSRAVLHDDLSQEWLAMMTLWVTNDLSWGHHGSRIVWRKSPTVCTSLQSGSTNLMQACVISTPLFISIFLEGWNFFCHFSF